MFIILIIAFGLKPVDNISISMRLKLSKVTQVLKVINV